MGLVATISILPGRPDAWKANASAAVVFLFVSSVGNVSDVLSVMAFSPVGVFVLLRKHFSEAYAKRKQFGRGIFLEFVGACG